MEEEETLPAEVVTGPEYDPQDAYHVRLWELAGKPPLDDGSDWRPTVTMLLQPDGQTYERMTLPPASPVTDVEIATGNFKRAREAAPEALDRLKGAVWAGQVAGGMAPDEATAAGVGLVLLHGPLLAAFEAAGGHPVAAQALYAAIASEASVAALPWLTAPILGIFRAALTPGK